MKKKPYTVIDLNERSDINSVNAADHTDINDQANKRAATKRKTARRSTETNNRRTRSDSSSRRNNKNTKHSYTKTDDGKIYLKKKSHDLEIIPLGGLEEIGKNMTVIRYKGSAVIIDCGMAFPDDDLLGIDVVIPDFSFIEQIRDEITALVLTHGHEDHIGGIPFLLKTIKVPIYGTALTIGLVKNKLIDSGEEDFSLLNIVSDGDIIQLGNFSVEFIHMNHSIPGSVALAVTFEAGTIIHTGDFKIDYTPVVEGTADLNRLAEYGSKGVLC